MEVVNLIYNGHEVDFEPTGADNVMVNATQMAKVFGKDVPDFLILKQTKSFISECLNNQNSGYLGVKIESDLVDSRQKSGTWMHRVLALKFAAWLNPSFELWVYITIDKIINQYFREMRESMVQRLTIAEKKKAMQAELVMKYPEITEYFDLEKQEQRAKAQQGKQVQNQLKQLQLELFRSVS